MWSFPVCHEKRLGCGFANTRNLRVWCALRASIPRADGRQVPKDMSSFVAPPMVYDNRVVSREARSELT